MSGRYVSRVLESGLPPDLKFTAAVFASFADDDGLCWPSIGHVAHLRGLEERRVQYHVKEFRRMELFEIVRPATQWHPTYYRLHLDRLPGLAPYQPPDRQPTFLEPGGESPSRGDPGVHSAAPPPGVHSTAPGVQPSAPDPSVRSVSTHTYVRTREPGVQPSAPLTDAAPGESPLPLVGPVPRDRGHDAHAWCGRVCVPKFLHRQFKHQLGGPVTRKPARLRAFYDETVAAVSPTQDIGDEPVTFWRKAFAARFGHVAPAPAAPLSRREIDEAQRLRAQVYNGCPHEPRCTDGYGACVGRIAQHRRARVG